MRQRNNLTYYTSIVKNIRNGASEIVFSHKQVEEVRKRLNEDEKLIVKDISSGILIELEASK